MNEPKCPKCGLVMCEQFDELPKGIVVPNGYHACYHCGLIFSPEQLILF
jgi:diadenosine tetraphosphatase ApaH/serine/threonine PP2A family protein phosphatase